MYIYVYIMYVYIYVYHNFHHSHVSKREFPKIKFKLNYPDVEFFKQNVSIFHVFSEVSIVFNDWFNSNKKCFE